MRTRRQMHFHTSGRIAWAAAIALLVWQGPVTAEYTYTDGSFGVSITFPDGTAVTRVTTPAGETGTEIGQFTLPGGNTVGRLVVSDLPEKWSVAKVIAMVRDQLAKDAKVEAEKITAEKVKVQGNSKSASLLQAWDGDHTLQNAILIAQGPSDQMLLLYIATRESPKDEAQKITRQIVEGFDLLLQAKDEKSYQAAITKGSAMLMGIAAPIPKAEDLWQNQYFLIAGPKEPLGYILINESAEDRAGRPGIRMKSDKWIFYPSGDAEYEVQNAYATWDLHEDEWTSHSETAMQPATTAPGAPPAPVKIVSFDQKVLRLGQQLLVEATDPKRVGDTRGPSKKVNRVVPCPRNFMPAAWRWILPRLLMDRTAGGQTGSGEWLAVVIYSPQRRGLETQMLSRATHGQVRQVLQREGLYGQTETWSFEPSGKLRQVNGQGFRLVPASKAEVERLFAGRIARWQAKVNPKK